jgi:phosphoglycolate phosphatase-like HAD superfamily hydrolase
MVEVYGTPAVLARELYLATCGLPFAAQLQEIYPGDPRNEGASQTFESRKPARCSAIAMASDTRRVLESLRKNGVKIVVSSNNGVENVRTFARASQFDFDLTLGFGGGLAKGRPHFDATSRFFGLDRKEMMFVGDSLHDGEIAEREGVPFVALATTFSPERFMLRFPHVPVLRRFSALPELFPGV